VGSKAFGGLNRRLKEKTAESRWFETTGQAPFGRAKAAYWKINYDDSRKNSSHKSKSQFCKVGEYTRQERYGFTDTRVFFSLAR
jgi:hypothetical protein